LLDSPLIEGTTSRGCGDTGRGDTVAISVSQWMWRPDGAGRGPGKVSRRMCSCEILGNTPHRHPTGRPDRLSPPIW